MLHRGPNDEGLHSFQLPSGTICLGHRRLSILDLSPLGHQPMVHPQTGDAIVFNGEIYNFKAIRAELEKQGSVFVGQSDTEVLLHALVAWGEKAVSRLSGMYAFAFLHRASRRILLARDPLGIKPLYVAEKPSGPSGKASLAVASQVRALLAMGVVSDEPDLAGVATLLAYGTVLEPLTFFKQIRMFPPGCMQWWSVSEDGSASPHAIERFWQFPAIDQSMTQSRAVHQLRDLLRKSVAEHLVADVPVGVFLSSGIDSTVMAAKARKLSPSIRTFTLGFLDQPDLNEGELARESARVLGVEHHDIQITSDIALRYSERWFETVDQPSVDGLNTYIVSAAVRDAGVAVAISGLGGDELFCGYSTFYDTPRIQRLLRRASAFGLPTQRLLLSLAGFGRPSTVKEKLLSMAEIGDDLAQLAIERRRLINDSGVRALGLHEDRLGLARGYVPKGIVSEAIRSADAGEQSQDPIAIISRVESAFYMRNMLLRDTDSTSMQHSLEVRVPFLDLDVVNFAYAIPGHVRSPNGQANKHLLRVAFQDVLRPQLLNQQKRGFVLPLRRWMRGHLRPLCESCLETLKGSGLVEAKAVDAIWQSFLAEPEHRVWSHALLLCSVGEYLRTVRAVPLTQAAPAHLIRTQL
jgi:asparagine synthase (glutamine-hydrolysing)